MGWYPNGRRRGLVTLLCFASMLWLLASHFTLERRVQNCMASGCAVGSAGLKTCSPSTPDRDMNPPRVSTAAYRVVIQPPAP
ncbi:unnamed protein product [Musa hybrid cultivar]